MWQRFPNMFPPPSTPHPTASLAFSSLCQAAKSEGYEMGVMGRLYDCHVWGVCKPTLTHTYTQCMCVCVCIYNSSAHVAKDVESSTSRTCNVQRGSEQNFWSELNAVFLAASHDASQQMGWVQPKVEWSRFFLGACLCVCAHFASGQAKPRQARQASSSSSSSSCVCILRCMHSLCTAPLACLPIRFLGPLHSALPACNFVAIFLGKMSINARVQLIKRLSNVTTSQRQQGEAIINSKSPPQLPE